MMKKITIQKFRKAFLLTFFLGALLLSCMKENSKTESASPDFVKLHRVIAWLDEQKQQFKHPNNQNALTVLKENLICSQLSIETLNDKEKIIIIPLKKEFNTSNITTQSSLKNLVIIEREGHELIQGNIIEIISKNQRYDDLPTNLISKIYSNRDNELTGIFRILSLTNNFVFEKEYKDGRLFSTKYLSKKNENSQVGKGTTSLNTCIDWYLVETTYYTDGSYFQTATYLFTTCGNECQSTRTMNSTAPFKLNCGGGGGSDEDDSLITSNIDFEEVETDADDGLGGVASSYVPIKWHYRAKVSYYGRSGVVFNVLIDPITADPMVSSFIDSYNRSGARSLTLFGHYNTWTPLTSTSVRINWSCIVHAKYACIDGTLWTRQWNKNRSKVY